MSTATQLLTPLLVIALIAALLAVARLFHGWVMARSSDLVEVEDKDLIALEDRKEQLLTTLRDLEFEHATGKLSDEDYNDLKRFFEREAVGLMSELDGLT